MLFDSIPGPELNIGSGTYHFTEHPNAHGFVYGQEGRRGIVYQLIAADGSPQALKVFKPHFRVPRMVAVAEKLAPYAALPGLQACQRIVLTSTRHPDLLGQFPDLTYAVLMPWVEGSTWQEKILGHEECTPTQSLEMARSLTQVLVSMEERGLAHCDLSGPNLILSPMNEAALVDLEEMYGPDFIRPKERPSGSPGYAHKSAPLGLWQEEADRFAGALLLGEMVGWCDECVRQAAWGESFFDPVEMQTDCKRYSILLKTLESCWGKRTKELFIQTWHSDSLLDCPTFAEWNIALRQVVSQPVTISDLAVIVDNVGSVYQPGETSRIDSIEKASLLDAWTCPHCGKEVQESQEVCPYCERSREAVVAPQIRTSRRIPFWGWIAGGVAILFLVFGGGIIIPPLFQPTLTPTSGTTQLPMVTPTQTQARPFTPTSALTLSTSPSPTPEPSQTLKPTLISSDTPTPLPIAVVSAEITDIRSGPGTVYSINQMATKGMNLQIIGRSPDSTWLEIILPDESQGWVRLNVVEMNVLLETLPVIAIPTTLVPFSLTSTPSLIPPTSTSVPILRTSTPSPIPPTSTPVQISLTSTPSPISPTSSPSPEYIIIYSQYDLNQDCIVDSKDIDIWGSAKLGCKIGDACYEKRFDFNNDGIVDLLDGLLLTDHLNEVCQRVAK